MLVNHKEEKMKKQNSIFKEKEKYIERKTAK